MPVCATSTTSAAGAASRAARKPPGRGASTLVIASARSAIRCMPSLRSRSIPRSRRRGVKLPPSGKITNASFSSSPVASSAIWSSMRSPAAGFGRDEPGRDPVQQHVDGRVPRQRVLEDDARLAVVPVHQRVDQREGVARPRVPAADQQRLAGVRVGRRAGGLDGQVEHPPGLAEEHPEHALDEVVVDALVVRRPDPRPEARRDPQPEQDDQQHALADQVQDQHPQQAQRSPATRQQGRQRGRGDQPQRERDADQDRHQDHGGRGDQPAYLAARPGVAPAHRGTCSSR